MTETIQEQISRVRQMVIDDGDTWDLSDNDKAALKALLAALDAAIEQPLRDQNEQLEPAASERDSIAALVSDRPEVGTYGKVEGLQARVQELEQALREALDGWEDAAQYKGGYLSTKHGDADDIARLRAAFASPASEARS